MTDDRTTHYNLQLPHQKNLLLDDVARLRSTLSAIDGFLNGLQADLDTMEGRPGVDIATLVGGKVPAGQMPDTDSVAEGAANKYFTDARARAALQAATATLLGGIKVGSGLSIGLDGVLSAIGGGGVGLPAFNELVLVPSTNGQTSFTPAGGYSAGQIELYLNGVLLTGNGEDYTASNGTTIVLTAGVNTDDRLLLRRWTTADSLPFSAVTAKPTTRDGYGITDVPLTLDVLLKSGNLSGLTDVAAARTALQLGTAARAGISGTAAQSGGYPTATTALMESAVHLTYGYSLRLADGWQICWDFDTSARNINTAVGSTYVSAALSYTFIKPFVTVPVVIPFAFGAAGAPAWAGNSIPTTTDVSGIYLMAAQSGVTAKCGYIAIGRWYTAAGATPK